MLNQLSSILAGASGGGGGMQLAFAGVEGYAASIGISGTAVGSLIGSIGVVGAGVAIVFADVTGIGHDAGKFIESIQDASKGMGNEERRYSPNDGKHQGSAKGDISADPFWDNPAAGQESLKSAYSSSDTKQLYNVHDGKLVKFQPDNTGGWHAYEVINPAEEVPTDVLRQMKNNGLITNAQYNKWIKNK